MKLCMVASELESLAIKLTTDVHIGSSVLWDIIPPAKDI